MGPPLEKFLEPTFSFESTEGFLLLNLLIKEDIELNLIKKL
jgi:hypothetical protein